MLTIHSHDIRIAREQPNCLLRIHERTSSSHREDGEPHTNWKDCGPTWRDYVDHQAPALNLGSYLVLLEYVSHRINCLAYRSLKIIIGLEPVRQAKCPIALNCCLLRHLNSNMEDH